MIGLSKRKLKRIVISVLLILCVFEFIQLTSNIKNYSQIEEKHPTPVETTIHFDYGNNLEVSYETEQFLDSSNKYILLVKSKQPPKYPFTTFTLGNVIFTENACDFTNCYIIDDRTFIDEASFDMVAFNAPDLHDLEVPENRSLHQKYAFFSYESPQYHPVCIDIYDDFFNWTFTYKLNSDFRWWFFEIYDLNDTRIGPPVDVWPDFGSIDDDLKSKLDEKTRMAAWFVSNCDTISGREWVAKELNKELKERYGWSIDIYGSCGDYACPRRYAELCNQRIEKRYFFYLALENSFAEDYVTEKILLGLNNLAIPVVYGAVNYSRFLPPGSYLDARELGTQELARIMNKIVTHREILYDYFKWTNHITFRHVSARSQICGLCATLNDRKQMKANSMYPEFRNWWNAEGWDDSCSLSRDYF
ncbi:alpha-(1,3)-fucosyltransferase C-like [Zerene cesonia]|uniref:alpha-(1,3)-fucosyltransferase C-like n=1 Tax=Zerene cesonia TaxID=33412 RepID=UPI0018E59D99|nr:alpha-(1,3)-fucosyltransferase C-like [Zerene cesonia]